ncbi:MAG: TVP38/TMEM64 family protein [Clostridia bacterium]|nr:TVP38/TMEM64 family protein [Clostridia bacterium]
MKNERFKTKTAKRIIGLLSLAAVIVVFGLVSYFAIYKFFVFGTDAQSFENFIKGYGWYGRFVALGIQVLQVFVAIIPGEFVEVGLGLAFGFVEGTILCLLGVGLASWIIFLLVKKWGVKFVELFISRDKIDSLRFINSEKKLNTLVFVLFLIPGTPKDLLTYFVPLTRMKVSEFLLISMFARIPSVVSSTIGGDFFGNGKYLEGILLFLITGAISLLGIILYRKILAKHRERKAKKEDA